jgi:ornithine cyclodeaminase/alanine dehydrogenase-like protein (mu-crystallin family)
MRLGLAIEDMVAAIGIHQRATAFSLGTRLLL